MKRAHTLCLLFVMSAAVVAFSGDVQVSCEPGLRIFLDGKLMGTSTTKQDGLFLSDVPSGARTIRVEKDGFVPQSIQIEVSSYPIEVRIGKLSPEPEIHYKKQPDAEPEPEKRLFGNLTVTSAPQNCTVEIDGRSETKDSPQLAIGRIEAGEHTITFKKSGYDTVSDVITIHPGADVNVKGNLIDGRVEVLYEGRGSLQIISNPNRCTIYFRGHAHEKIHNKFNLTHIPAGEYPLIIEMRGRKLYRNVLIMDEQRTVLEVSFVKGEKPFIVSYVPH